MKPLHYFLSIIVLLPLVSSCQSEKNAEAVKSIEAFQYKLNTEYANPEESPLTEEDLAHFSQLDFYPIDLKYRIKARFEKNENPEPFAMATTTERKPMYQKYGTLYFQIDEQDCKLAVYQSIDLLTSAEYQDYLFVPYTDLTSGNTSYGGGRYIDLTLPLADEVTLDFNQSYNPYCAYNHKFSCVVPPKENDLDIAIKAGVKNFH